MDASALLAYLFRESGHEEVKKHLDDCCISTVNLSEVIGRFTRDGHKADEVLERISATNIEIVPFSASHSAIVATLLPQTKSLGLSLADRACLALAKEQEVEALTADRVWQQMELGIKIKLIR
ncbi:MAG: type II toxin-antitoxin system VapC family toxin [Chloroflexota bacterium]